MKRFAAALACAAVSACGSHGTPDPLMTLHGGAALRSPRLVTITWADYEFRDQVEAFGGFIVGSAWLKSVTAEYGVGAATHSVVRLQEPSPAMLTDLDLQHETSKRIQSGELPAPDGQTIYMFYISAVTNAVGQDGPACSSAGAYHAAGPTRDSLYGVVYDCTGRPDDVTVSASHELVEAITDPLTNGWYVDYAHLPLSLETADRCQNEAPVDAGNFKVTRAWSNEAAANGENPCVPAPPGEVYYTVSISPAGAQLVKPGQTVTFDVTGWANGAIDPWVLSLLPGAHSQMDIAASLDTNRIANGGHAKLTLTAPLQPHSLLPAAYVDICSGPELGRCEQAGINMPGVVDEKPPTDR